MKVGIIQLCSVLDPQENLAKIRHFLEQANHLGVEAIFLPECFYSMSDGTEATPYLVEKGNEHYENIRSLATDFHVHILAGTAATAKNGKVVNRSYNFDSEGNDLGIYDKINLFSCAIKTDFGEKIIDESDIYSPGSSSSVVKVDDLVIGQSICFDVRFPNMFRDYALNDGANMITIPAAFTVPSGEGHWHVLVRARAIESQCFVIAPAQWGKHNDKIETYGHSLIVDPWGKVLVDAKEGEKLIVADLDLSMIDKVRQSIPVL